jgi:hypothetical protein
MGLVLTGGAPYADSPTMKARPPAAAPAFANGGLGVLPTVNASTFVIAFVARVAGGRPSRPAPRTPARRTHETVVAMAVLGVDVVMVLLAGTLTVAVQRWLRSRRPQDRSLASVGAGLVAGPSTYHLAPNRSTPSPRTSPGVASPTYSWSGWPWSVDRWSLPAERRRPPWSARIPSGPGWAGSATASATPPIARPRRRVRWAPEARDRGGAWPDCPGGAALHQGTTRRSGAGAAGPAWKGGGRGVRPTTPGGPAALEAGTADGRHGGPGPVASGAGLRVHGVEPPPAGPGPRCREQHSVSSR